MHVSGFEGSHVALNSHLSQIEQVYSVRMWWSFGLQRIFVASKMILVGFDGVILAALPLSNYHVGGSEAKR